jgi:hypothetical protein
MKTVAEKRASDTAPTLSLDPERIVDTIATLSLRIAERFPGSSLGRLSESLLQIGRDTKAHLTKSTGLSSKIWQKIMMLDTSQGSG